MRTKIQVYLGYDQREDKAYQVAKESIRKRCATPLSIIPLRLKHLDGILTRPIERRDGKLWCPISEAPMSTEFAISRFCVPFLQREGWALFADCDIICWEDINNLFALADDKYAVMVVKHKQEEDPRFQTYSTESLAEYKRIARKMDGQIQTSYARKNWSSVVLWNCDHPANKRLTSEALNTWPGRDLHAFKWLEDSEIGYLPPHWNWLVNIEPYVVDETIMEVGTELVDRVVIEHETKPMKQGIWHYTEGLPIFANYKETKYNQEWMAEYQSL